MKNMFQYLWLLAITIISGCATGHYTTLVKNPDYKTQDDQSLIVFMRPSSVGRAISSSVFELDNTNDIGYKFIGILGPKEKIAYYTTPGANKRFMVISENADFMDANLSAGKAYHAIITPRLGWWKARFSLHPFKKIAGEPEFQLDSKEHVKWLNECNFVIPNEKSIEWAKNNSLSINNKKVEYLQKWEKMLEQDKQWRRLEPEDGLLTIY